MKLLGRVVIFFEELMEDVGDRMRQSAHRMRKRAMRMKMHMKQKRICMNGRFVIPAAVCAAACVLMLLIGVIGTFFPGVLAAITVVVYDVLIVRILLMIALAVLLCFCGAFCWWLIDLVRHSHIRNYESGILTAEPRRGWWDMDAQCDDEYDDGYEEDCGEEYSGYEGDSYDDSYEDDSCIREFMRDMGDESGQGSFKEPFEEKASQEKSSEEKSSEEGVSEETQSEKDKSEEVKSQEAESEKAPGRMNIEFDPPVMDGFTEPKKNRIPRPPRWVGASAQPDVQIVSFDRVIEGEGRVTLKYTRGYVVGLVRQAIEEADDCLSVVELDVNFLRDAIEIELGANVAKDADHEQLVERLYIRLRETLGGIAQHSQIMLSLTVRGVFGPCRGAETR